jgi:hypothetical protein
MTADSREREHFQGSSRSGAERRLQGWTAGVLKTRLIGAIAIVAGMMTSRINIEAAPKLSLRVSPAISSAPATVVVTATVPKDAGNRSLAIAADSGTFYRSSEVQPEGEEAPLVTQVCLKNLPGGHYEIVVVLRDNRGNQTIARAGVMILSPGTEP